MQLNRAASRYAKSLLDLAIEQNKLEDVQAGVLTVQGALAESKDLELLVSSQVVQEDKMAKALQAVFAGKIDELLMNFILLVAKNNRSTIIPDILTAFELKYKVYKKVLVVELKSAVKLADKQKEEIKKLLLKGDDFKDVELQEVIDPSLIGGFIISTGEKQYDASIATKLRELKANFSTAHFESKL
jgi:F-type H+-transporting ATPase subunit delta